MLSSIEQDEKQGMIADIASAIKKNEDVDDRSPERKERYETCILPRTTFEFEGS
jgi:hypothetical protein